MPVDGSANGWRVQRRITAVAAVLMGGGVFGHVLGLLSASAAGGVLLVGGASAVFGALAATALNRL